VLNNIGEKYRRSGRIREARECLYEALAIQIELDDMQKRFTLCTLGELEDDLGDRAAAAGYYQQALEVAINCNDRWVSALLLDKLGNATATLGDRTTAQKYWQEAATCYDEIGDHTAAAELRQRLNTEPKHRTAADSVELRTNAVKRPE
jgi:tetratricopeptide (TPR) repeat protein